MIYKGVLIDDGRIDYTVMEGGYTISQWMQNLHIKQVCRPDLIDSNRDVFTESMLPETSTTCVTSGMVIKISPSWLANYKTLTVVKSISLSYKKGSIAFEGDKASQPNQRFILCSKKIETNNVVEWSSPVLLMTDKTGGLYKVKSKSKGLSLSKGDPHKIIKKRLASLDEKIKKNGATEHNFSNQFAKSIGSFFRKEYEQLDKWLNPLYAYKGGEFEAEVDQEYYLMFAPLDVIYSGVDSVDSVDRVDSGFLSADGQKENKYNIYAVLNKAIASFSKNNKYSSQQVEQLITKGSGDKIKVTLTQSNYDIKANFQERLSLLSLKYRDVTTLLSGLQKEKLNHLVAINDINSIKNWINILLRHPQDPYTGDDNHNEFYEYLGYCDDFIRLIKIKYINNDKEYKLPYNNSNVLYVNRIEKELNQLIVQLNHLDEKNDVTPFLEDLSIFTNSEKKSALVKETYLFKESFFYDVLIETYRVIAKHPNKSIVKKFYIENCLPVINKSSKKFDEILESSDKTKKYLELLLSESYMTGAFYEDKQKKLSYDISVTEQNAFNSVFKTNDKPKKTKSSFEQLYDAATEYIPKDSIKGKIAPNIWNNQGGTDSFVTRILKFYAVLHYRANTDSGLYAKVCAMTLVKSSFVELFWSNAKSIKRSLLGKTSATIFETYSPQIKELNYEVRNAARLNNQERIANKIRTAPKIVSILVSSLGALYALHSIWAVKNSKSELTTDDYLKITNSTISLGFALTGLHIQDAPYLKNIFGKIADSSLGKVSSFIGKVAVPVSIAIEVYFAVDDYHDARTRGNDLEMQVILISTGCSIAGGLIFTVSGWLTLSLGAIVVTGGIGILLVVVAIAANIFYDIYKDNFLVLSGLNGVIGDLNKKSNFFTQAYLSSRDKYVKNAGFLGIIKKDIVAEKAGVVGVNGKIGKFNGFTVFDSNDAADRQNFEGYCVVIWGYLQKIGKLTYRYVDTDVVLYQLMSKGLSKPYIYNLFKDRKAKENKTRLDIYTRQALQPSCISATKLKEPMDDFSFPALDDSDIEALVSDRHLIKVNEDKYSVTKSLPDLLFSSLDKPLRKNVELLVNINLLKNVLVTKCDFMKIKNFTISMFDSLISSEVLTELHTV